MPVVRGNLRKGLRDPRVLFLQQGLQNAGFRVTPSGHFDHLTGKALRSFQRQNGLLPDGIATAYVIDVLATFKGPVGCPPIPLRCTYEPPAFPFMHTMLQPWSPPFWSQVHGISYLPRMMRTSERGKDFVFFHEAGKGETTGHLHFPEGASGVTLGAGYDMKTRTKQSIIDALSSVGVKADVAAKIAEAAGRDGEDARRFARENAKLVNLTVPQQKNLLDLCLDEQEGVVRRQLHVHLVQHEFDALVSFAGNCGGMFVTAAGYVNSGKIKEAMSTILSVLGKAKVKKGLRQRRECEVQFYLYGKCSHSF